MTTIETYFDRVFESSLLALTAYHAPSPAVQYLLGRGADPNARGVSGRHATNARERRNVSSCSYRLAVMYSLENNRGRTVLNVLGSSKEAF